jgi:uncharacterized protein
MFSLFIFICSIVLLDLYCFYGLKRGFRKTIQNQNLKLILYVGYGAVTVIFFLIVFLLPFFGTGLLNIDRIQAVEWISIYILLFYLPKIFFLPFILILDISCFFLYLLNKIFTRFNFPIPYVKIYRYLVLFFIRFGFSLSVIVLLCGAYGTSVGRNAIQVKPVEIVFPDLPESFNNFKIVHISDWHIGTYKSDSERMKIVINLINEQNPDAVMFTGDLVNFSAEETAGCKEYISRIDAKYGKYSVLGNHDGEHTPWKSRQEKTDNYNKLFQFYDSCGFQLLRNEHAFIKKDNDSIAVCGVNYWISDIFKSLRTSALMDSEYLSDLNKTVIKIDRRTFKILLAHDPTQWDAEVVNKTNIDLTLSGHTHGGQFAINYGDFKWSPADWFYNQWYDLHRKGDQYLYVNPGLGYIGIPARIGIPPEITVINLKK